MKSQSGLRIEFSTHFINSSVGRSYNYKLQRPRLFEAWIALSTELISIRWIAQYVSQSLIRRVAQYVSQLLIHWIAIYLLNKSLSALIQLGPDLYKAVLLRVFYFSAPRTLGDLIRSIIFQNIHTFSRINEFEISTKVFQCF